MPPTVPLSKHLRDVTTYANQHGPEILQRWTHSEDPRQWMDTLVPDEVELLAVTGRMIQRLEKAFSLFDPRVVGPIYQAYEKASQDPDAYFATVLEDQRTKIMQIFEQIPESAADLEKRRNKILQGGHQLFAEYNRLLNETEDLAEFITDINPGSIRPIRVKETASLEHIERKIKKETQRLINNRIRAYKQKLKRIDAIDQELTEREKQIALLERRILIRKALEERLEKIETIIGPPTASQTLPPTQPPPPPATDQPTQKQHPSPKKRPTKGKRRRRKKDHTTPQTSAREDQAIGPLDFSLNQIRQAISLADENGTNKIRIILTNQPHRSNHEQRWAELLKALGFTGEIEFIDFPDNNGDLSPILIPRGLNTHGNRWDRTNLEAKYFVIRIDRPNLLLNHLNPPNA